MIAAQRSMQSEKGSMYLRLCLVWLMCLASPVLLRAQESTDGPVAGPLPAPKTAPATMTNDSVVRMAKAGLSDDLIVQTIGSQPGQYATDADSLVALKQAGISERVITAMINKGRIRLTGPDTPVVLSDVNEIGVYYKDRNGKWQPIESEVVHIKSGGFIKSTVTNGIIKPDRNGHVNGRESKLLLPRPIEFLIYTPDGVDANEYDLLRFRLNSNSREFRAWTGGVIHSTGGAQRDEVPFKPEKTAPHTYQFTVGTDTPGGEYGILPPGTGNVTNGGKIYTFAISE
jgi:hypothetical protein